METGVKRQAKPTDSRVATGDRSPYFAALPNAGCRGRRQSINNCHEVWRGYCRAVGRSMGSFARSCLARRQLQSAAAASLSLRLATPAASRDASCQLPVASCQLPVAATNQSDGDIISQGYNIQQYCLVKNTISILHG